VRLVADGIPAQLDAFVTSASTPLGTQPLRVERDAIVLPARSIMTVVSSSYLDQPSAAAGPELASAEPGSRRATHASAERLAFVWRPAAGLRIPIRQQGSRRAPFGRSARSISIV
jgi:hypothetical protein